MNSQAHTSEVVPPGSLVLMAGFSRRWRDWLSTAFPELTFNDLGNRQALLGELQSRTCAALLLGPKLRAKDVSEVLAQLANHSPSRPLVLYCAGKEGWDRSGEGLDRLLLPPLGRRRLAFELAQLIQAPNSVDSAEWAGTTTQPTAQKLFSHLTRAVAANHRVRAIEVTQQMTALSKELDLSKAMDAMEILATQLQQEQIEEALLTCMQLRAHLYPMSWIRKHRSKFPRLWIRVDNPEISEVLRQLGVSEGFEVVLGSGQESPMVAFFKTQPDAMVLSLPCGQPSWLEALLLGWPELPFVMVETETGGNECCKIWQRCRSLLQHPVSPAYIMEQLCHQVDHQRRRPYRIYIGDSLARDHDSFRQALSLWEIEVGESPGGEDDLWLLDVQRWEHSILPIGHPPILLLREPGQFPTAAVDTLSLPLCLEELFQRVHQLWSWTRQEALLGSHTWMEARFCVEQLLRLAARHGQPSSLAVLRVFERTASKEREGRVAIQERLTGLSSLLKSEIRAGDVLVQLSESTLLLAMYGMRRADGMTRLAPHLAGDIFNAGLAEFPEDGDDLTALLQAAELALDTAEFAGSGRVVYVGWSEDPHAKRVDILFITYATATGADELTRGFHREGYSHYRWDYDPATPPVTLPQHWRLCLVEPPKGANWRDFAPLLEAIGAGSRTLILLPPEPALDQDWKRLGIQVDPLSLMKCLRDKLGFKGAWTVRSRRDGGLRRRQTLFSQLSLARRDQEHAEALISTMQKRQEKLSRELALARDIQTNLLPRRVCSVKGWEFYFAVVPARIVGGDLVHCSSSPLGGRVVLADVSGKGVAAAILVGSLHEILRTTEHLPLPEAVAKINDAFFRITPSEVSVALLLVDFTVESGRLEICNCGCPEPLWFQDSRVSTVNGSGLPLGWFAEAMPEYRSVELQAGQTLLLHSDGLLDAFLPGSRERVGEERIQKSLEECGHLPLPELARQLMGLLDQESQPDDVAIWVARRNQAIAPSHAESAKAIPAQA
jgi:serine phosphatase RsbU (regulator of sigma subunit)